MKWYTRALRFMCFTFVQSTHKMRLHQSKHYWRCFIRVSFVNLAVFFFVSLSQSDIEINWNQTHTQHKSAYAHTFQIIQKFMTIRNGAICVCNWSSVIAMKLSGWDLVKLNIAHTYYQWTWIDEAKQWCDCKSAFYFLFTSDKVLGPYKSVCEMTKWR